MLKLIVCISNNNGIGKDNKIPWSNSEEMSHFKETTLNHTVVMGRKTFESIGKALPNRKNIVLTRNKQLNLGPEIKVINDYYEIIELSKKEDVFIIGGSEIYELFMDYYDELIISKLNDNYECDRFFKFNEALYILDKEINKETFQVKIYKKNKKILNGRKVSNDIKNILIKKKNKLVEKYKIIPHLVIINVGNDFASSIYIKSKMKLASEIGIQVTNVSLNNISQDDLIGLIDKFNSKDNIHGILIQKPLPASFNEDLINKSINPQKDVDCFHPINVGKLWTLEKNTNIENLILPCTPIGIITLLDKYGINIESNDVVILGRSNIVSKPLASLMICKNATVQICHSKTKDLESKCKNADIIVSAIGKAKIINKNFVKKDSIIIDVGINRSDNNTICGDVDFGDVLPSVSYITPVPGGVGPLTLVMLFKNLLNCYEQNFMSLNKKHTN